MTNQFDSDDACGSEEIVRAIRAILGEEDRPLTREEARELDALRARLKRPSKKSLRQLGRRLAKPDEP
jgi:hypothetical protein